MAQQYFPKGRGGKIENGNRGDGQVLRFVGSDKPVSGLVTTCEHERKAQKRENLGVVGLI